MRKLSLYKTSLVFLLFSVLDLVFVGYYYLRCIITHSNYYCGVFEFGYIIYWFGIPALALLVLFFIGTIVAKFYKQNVDEFTSFVFILLGLLIFLVPYYPKTFEITYKEFQDQAEVQKKKIIIDQKNECLKYKKEYAQWSEGKPMPLPPLFCE